MGLAESHSCSAPTGGFLMVYPFVAFLAGYIFDRSERPLSARRSAGLLAEVLLFAGGLTWLYVSTHSLAKAAYFGLVLVCGC